MAQYIGKEQVFPYCSYNGDCMGSGSDCQKCPDNVIDYQDFMEMPAADVTEREKIDAALAEIKDNKAEIACLFDDDQDKGIEAILKIVKTHIGEQ